MKTAGLLLAAGAGHRIGTPKALIRDASGLAWAVRTARVLAAAGCSPVLVIIGAAAEQVAAALANEPVELVESPNWDQGMSASLQAGLTALQHPTTPQPTPTPPQHLTDPQPAPTPSQHLTDATPPQHLTDATPPQHDPAPPEHGAASPQWSEVVAALIVPVDVPGLTPEVVQRVSAHAGRTALARAVYHGTPGHPVLLGRDHWDGVIATAVGDQGARAYLEQHPPVEVECGDLADGVDVDTVEELPEGHRLG